nr:wall-associated receptor kinase 5 [Quercus suber]
MVLDWAIGKETCEEVALNKGNYICGANSNCSSRTNGSGYRCKCKEGYEGNPYLEEGCQDINECVSKDLNDCKSNQDCINEPGSYHCSCIGGYHADGDACVADQPTSKSSLAINLTVGAGIGLIVMFVCCSWLYLIIKKRNLIKLKEKFFKQNGGLVLQYQLSRQESSTETAKIFTIEELKKATNNYDETLIIGRGGFGIVYKGLLSDDRIVAIKKSKMVDQSQIEQFINEVVVLSQINHRNVVKLLGCCLETSVPLLVYEFVANGTLFEYIHNESKVSTLSWEICLRIATETAEALSYLHSAASTPIIHRDVKSSNILLDSSYTAKVSDFGASRLIPLDQTEVATMVQGTIGYLDPEYLHTSQLTEKSDVYSFGVVLVELLTGRKALSFDKPEMERSLVTYFLLSLKENRLYAEPSIRPDDSCYGENPNRLQRHTQFQVILKPDPGNSQDLFIRSLSALGIDVSAHDIQFVEDNWESLVLGAWGLGWEIWMDGMEITQFTYFQQAGSLQLSPISVEITYGLERILMLPQGVDHFKKIQYADGITYGELFLENEKEMSAYYLEHASVHHLQKHFDFFEEEARSLLA